ncbi:hypothetical protein ACUOFC_54825, partial [Escherichia sp. TWPC-MK]
MPHTIKKMSLIGLILMIFTSVFGRLQLMNGAATYSS